MVQKEIREKKMKPKVCDLNFTNTVNTLANKVTSAVGKAVKDQPEKFLGQSNVTQKYIKEVMEDVKKVVSHTLAGMDRDTIDMDVLDNLNGTLKRNVIDTLNTFKAQYENITFLENSTRGLKSEAEFKEALVGFFQRTDNVVKAEVLKFEKMIDNAIDNLDTGGVRSNPEVNIRSKDLWDNAVRGGDDVKDFLKEQGVTDPDEFLYLAFDSGKSKIPEIDVLARAYKFIDDSATSMVVSKAPYFNKLEGHVLPLRVNKLKAEDKGYFFYHQFLKKHADLDALTNGKADNEKVLNATIKGLYESVITDADYAASSKFKSTTNLFGHRKIHFKEKTGEFKYLKTFGDLDEGIIPLMLNHRKNLLKKVALHDMHGADIGFNAYNIAKYLQAKGVNYESATAMVNRSLKRLKSDADPKTTAEETMNTIAKSASNLISAGLTGSAFVRNLLYDNTIHTGIVNNLLQEGGIEEFIKPIWELVKTGLNSRQYDGIADALEAQGIAIQISQNKLFQDIEQGMRSVGKTKNTPLGKLEEFTGQLAEGVSKYGLSDAILKASRVSQAINVGSIMLKSTSKSWSDLPNGIKMSLEQSGIGMDEWKVLKKAPKLKHKGKDLMYDINRFEEIPDAAIEKIKLPLESIKDAKRRLSYNYQNLTTELVNELSSVTSLKGDIAFKGGLDINKGIGSWINLAFKFSNIALSQYYNMMRAGHKAAGLNPSKVGNSWGGMLDISLIPLGIKRPDIAGKILVGLTGGGLLNIWVNDILQGKTPRELTPATIVQALTSNGAGGVASILVNNMKFGDDIIGTPLTSLAKPVKHAAKNIAKGKPVTAARHLTKNMPFLNLWYAKGAVEALFREGLNSKPTPWERRQMRERKQKHLID